MKSKTLPFDECVRTRLSIENHEIIIINDVPLSGELIRRIEIALTFDDPGKVAFRLLTFPIDSLISFAETGNDDMIRQHVMAVLSMKYMAELALMYGRLMKKEPVITDEP